MNERVVSYSFNNVGALSGNYLWYTELPFGFTLMAVSAVAYAALQRSRYVIDAVNPSADVPADFRSWAQAREREFEDELKRIGRRVGRHWDSRVAVVVDV